MRSLDKILDTTITQGFPELMHEDIAVSYEALDELMQYGSLTDEGFYIDVDRTLENAPEEVIIGGLAHELSHIIAERELSLGATIKDKFAYLLSKRYKTLDERNTDMQVVLRGYGQELLSFLEYSEKTGYPHYAEDGLSIRELRRILNVK